MRIDARLWTWSTSVASPRQPGRPSRHRWSSRVVEIEHDVRNLGHRTLMVLLALVVILMTGTSGNVQSFIRYRCRRPILQQTSFSIRSAHQFAARWMVRVTSSPAWMVAAILAQPVGHRTRRLGHLLAAGWSPVARLVWLASIRLPVTSLAWLVTGLAAGASAAFGVCSPRTCRYGRTSLRVASS